MKAILTGFIAIALISVGAYYALNGVGYSSQEKFSGDNVRVE
ncbi:hypothetical protein ACM25N_09810 [Roseovarius sp. C7]